MKTLLRSLRRLWKLATCAHERTHCLVLPVDSGGVMKVFHAHLCVDCGLVAKVEVQPVQTQRLALNLPLGTFCPPAPGGERWN